QEQFARLICLHPISVPRFERVGNLIYAGVGEEIAGCDSGWIRNDRRDLQGMIAAADHIPPCDDLCRIKRSPRDEEGIRVRKLEPVALASPKSMGYHILGAIIPERVARCACKEFGITELGLLERS